MFIIYPHAYSGLVKVAPDAFQEVYKEMPVLENLITKGRVTGVGEEFLVEAEMKGKSARELNRFLLSSLRRVEKRTRLRAEWTSVDGITQGFFDYVLKQTI